MRKSTYITGVSVSQFHGEPEEYEFLVGFTDGREVGFTMNRKALERLRDDLNNEFPVSEAKANMAHTSDANYMPDQIKHMCELAHTYAEDGAYASAARVLEEIAKAVREHSERVGQAEVEENG